MINIKVSKPILIKAVKYCGNVHIKKEKDKVTKPVLLNQQDCEGLLH